MIGVNLIKFDTIFPQLTVDVGHCCHQCQFFLQKFLGAQGVRGQVFEWWYIAQILQKMQFISYVVVHLLFCLDSTVHQQVRSAEQTYCYSEIKFAKNFFGVHVLPLQFKQLPCDNYTLIVDFMTEMFEVLSANLKPAFQCCLLNASNSFLLDCLADFFVSSPMIWTVFAGAIFGQLTVSAHENCFPLANLAALHLTTTTQLTQTYSKIEIRPFLSFSFYWIYNRITDVRLERAVIVPLCRIQAFKGRESFAWEIIYSEMMLQGTTLQTESIRQLIQLYSIGMKRLNRLQKSPGSYFKNKINGLMAEKRVIRCLNDQQTHHSQLNENITPPHNQNLLSRKRELEIRLAYDIENINDKLSTIIRQEQARESEIQRMVHKILNSEQEKLCNKIKQHQRRVENSRTETKHQRLITEVSNTLQNCWQIGSFHLAADTEVGTPNISR